MIEQQIRPWSISDIQVLETLNIIRRELFALDSQLPLVFSDIFLPILDSQEVMMEPKIEARVLQAIKPRGQDRVLEIGTGSGYMAALLAYFAKSVTTVEIRPELADFAIDNFHKCRIPNIRVEVGDASAGWKVSENNTYDIICVSGGLKEIPINLKNQLNIGGKLLAFVGQEPVMSARLITRHSHDYFPTESLFETLVPMLKTESAGIEQFVFSLIGSFYAGFLSFYSLRLQ
jgi:protein-L-isoaspartate(D-aspartate) O-methyltransferase